jgi:predicted amidohydrolase
MKVVVAQSPAELDGPEARLAWLSAALAGADWGADLLVLPELFLSGYNVGPRLPAWGEAADGPFARRIAALAKAHGIAILYGYGEMADGVLYNAATCFGADGARLGGHRKLVMPPGMETAYFSGAAGYQTFELGGFKVAILICYDAEFPENMRAVAQMGAELVLVPTALGQQWGVVAQKVIPSRAFENGVFVCYANHAGVENGLTYLGQSCVVSPWGKDLARAGAVPEFLVAELQHGEVAAAQARLPYLVDLARLGRMEKE